MEIKRLYSKTKPLQWLTWVIVCFSLSACVSSTTKTELPESVAPSSHLSLSEDELRSKKLREAAIAEIHAKAEAAPYNEEAPYNGFQREGETSLLTPEEVAEKINRIKTASGRTPPRETEQEAAARERKLNALQRKGRNHYNSALKRIVAE